MSDNIKWSASKKKPLVYGDRIDVTVTTVSLGNALTEAKRRAGLLRDVEALALPQTLEMQGALPHGATGSEPVASSERRAAADSGGGERPVTPPETALAGPITRRAVSAATPVATERGERATERYNAKRAAVSVAPECPALTDDVDIDTLLS